VTESINNINWTETDQLLVLASDNSGIVRKQVSKENSTRNVTVQSRALRVDWIRNPTYKTDYPGYGALYKVMTRTETKALFDTDFARSVNDYCSVHFLWTMWLQVLIPYILYAGFAFIYITQLVEDVDDVT